MLVAATACKSPARVERDPAHHAALVQALTDVENSSGQARADARWKFNDLKTSLELRARPEDEDLLPRFEALLTSRDDDDVWLGVTLVAGVHRDSSLPKLWTVINDATRLAALRLHAVGSAASTYRDPKLIPVIRGFIEQGVGSSTDAIRALQYYPADPGVADYLRELVKNPKRVTVALEVLQRNRISYDPQRVAVAQHSHSFWAAGIDIDFPEDWPSEEREGYWVSFRNAPLDAFYGYWEVKAKPTADAARVLADLERRDELHNELSPELRKPAAPTWTRTGAKSVAAGSYSVERKGTQRIRRVVVLKVEARAVVVSGEAPRGKAKEFEDVFERMWPTVRIGTPNPEAAEAFTKAIQEGQKLRLGGP